MNSYQDYQRAKAQQDEARRQLDFVLSPRFRDLSLIPYVIDSQGHQEREVLIAGLVLLYAPRIIWEGVRMRRGIQKAIASALSCSGAHVSKTLGIARFHYLHDEAFRLRVERFARHLVAREEARRSAQLATLLLDNSG